MFWTAFKLTASCIVHVDTIQCDVVGVYDRHGPIRMIKTKLDIDER